jgi:hypothetical protein
MLRVTEYISVTAKEGRMFYFASAANIRQLYEVLPEKINIREE